MLEKQVNTQLINHYNELRRISNTSFEEKMSYGFKQINLYKLITKRSSWLHTNFEQSVFGQRFSSNQNTA